ncbi:MAG: hypothetical protein ACRD96_10775 [Bryobacteraceae bacterium]
MTFQHFNRRLHLYLALSLLPWFLMYGLSSVPFAHQGLLDPMYNDGVPLWTLRHERAYEIAVPEDGELRPVGERIVRDTGLEGSFGAHRVSPKVLEVYVHTFRHASRARYYIDQKKLTVEDRRFRWDHFLTGMHARGGFDQPGLLTRTWSVLVDLVCIGFLLWIASGVYMWWHVRGHRGWGWLALGSGALSFAVFLARL